MKRLRLLSMVVTMALLALALYWSPRRQAGFASPAECVAAFGEAYKDGDAERYLNCLAEPLRSQVRRQYADMRELSQSLHRESKDTVSWAQTAGGNEGRRAFVEVDEVRPSGTRRLRFRLERDRGGWRIAAIETPRDIPTAIPYGTHVKDVPDPSHSKR